MSDWTKERKIVSFPGAASTPEVILGKYLEMAKAGKIKKVAMVVQWDDETFEPVYMVMPISSLCMAAKVLDQAALCEMYRHDPPGPTNPDAA